MLTKKHRFIVSGFPILILFIMLIAATGTFYLNRAGDLFNGTYQHSFAVQISAEQANANLIAAHRAMKDVALSKTSEALEMALKDVDKNDKKFNLHMSEVNNIELGDNRVTDVLKSYNDWAPIRAQTIQYVISGEYDKALLNTQTKGAAQVELIQNKMEILIDYEGVETKLNYQSLLTDTKHSFNILVFLSILSILLAIWISFYINKRYANYEMQLYEEKENLKITLRSIGDGVITTDMDSNVHLLNDSAEQFTGWKRKDAIGKKFTEIFDINSAITKEKAKNPVEKVISTDEVCELTNHTILTSKDGTQRHIADSAAPIKDQYGITKGVVMVFRDITEKKKLENLVYEEKEQLRITFDSIGDGVITTDIDTNVTILNVMAEKFTGWSNEESMGKKFTEVFDITSAITGERATNPVEEVLYTNKICELENHTILTSKDGTQRHIADSAAPIKDQYGNTTGVVIVFRDVTEKKTSMDRIKFLSFHDSMTGLYNRAYFEKELQRIDEEGLLPVSIIMGDVNGLKLLNDVYGHKSGDELLKNIALILQQNCTKNDIIARWGGDEFTIILPQTSNFEASIICKNIKADCDNSNFKPIILSISLGVSTKSDKSNDLNTVLKDAEDRMYTHKLVEGKSARSTIISSLQKTLFERSSETEVHAKRMLLLANEFGNGINLTQYEMDEMQLLTLLHDIGKIGIADNILNKPGILSPEEWYEMKKHPE